MKCIYAIGPIFWQRIALELLFVLLTEHTCQSRQRMGRRA